MSLPDIRKGFAAHDVRLLRHHDLLGPLQSGNLSAYHLGVVFRVVVLTPGCHFLAELRYDERSGLVHVLHVDGRDSHFSLSAAQVQQLDRVSFKLRRQVGVHPERDNRFVNLLAGHRVPRLDH